MNALRLWWAAWKGRVQLAVVAIVLGVIGGQHLYIKALRAERDAARAELSSAVDANRTNQDTIRQLREANAGFAEANRLSEEAKEKLRADAEQAQREAERARRELARNRELDRRAPDCAALLDRSLSVCPDLVRRLWPDRHTN